jgi:diguanylate cyclase (GGDEF)-like protein
MDQERLDSSLESIRYLLSHLHSEVTALEDSYAQVLLVLRKLEGAADVDELTGLLRRRPFFQKWNALLAECEKLNESCGVLMIDIDHFKRINDTLGHPAGDEVIKGVASMLKQFESPQCVVGRYGGEEFAVVVRGTDAEVLGMAEMIRRRTENSELNCTVSVGVASTQQAGYDAPRLLESADQALYSAKRGGRKRVEAA